MSRAASPAIDEAPPPVRQTPVGRASRARPAVRFQLLDPLRGIAALWVFTFHYGFSDAFKSYLAPLVPITRAGHLGVPMFFVISGYCLMASIRTARSDGESTGSFLYRRILRIYPPYWCSVAVIVALPMIIEGLSALKTGTYVPPSAENVNYGFLNYGVKDWLRVLTLTQVFMPMPQATNLQFKFTSINAVVWTLAIEFQFYLVMAAALALGRRWAGFLAAVTLVSLPMWYLGRWDVNGIFLPYWPMFAIGIALYLLIERGMSYEGLVRGPGVAGPVAGMALLIVPFLAWTLEGREVDNLGFALGFGVVLWFVHSMDERFRDARRHANPIARAGLEASTKLGKMSYSLYLLHGRLQFLSLLVVRQLLPSGIVFDLAAIGLTCTMSYVFYLYCERPFIQSRTGVPIAAPVPAVDAAGA